MAPPAHNSSVLRSRVQTLLQRRRKQKVAMEISAPFDLKHEPVCLPGISEDELTVMREKAAASRIGVYEALSPTWYPSFDLPRPPRRPVGAGRPRNVPARSAW